MLKFTLLKIYNKKYIQLKLKKYSFLFNFLLESPMTKLIIIKVYTNKLK